MGFFTGTIKEEDLGEDLGEDLCEDLGEDLGEDLHQPVHGSSGVGDERFGLKIKFKLLSFIHIVHFCWRPSP